MQVQVPLVLLRGVRGVCAGCPDINMQLETSACQDPNYSAMMSWIGGNQSNKSHPELGMTFTYQYRQEDTLSSEPL